VNDLSTLSDAFDACARFVENGSGACDPATVTSRINEACERLMVKGDWPHSMVTVRARVDNWTFPLPEEIEAIRAINIDNRPSAASSPYFRFMSSGPGEERSWIGTCDKYLVEMGLYPSMYDLPSIDSPAGCRETDRVFDVDGLRLMAFSTSAVDVSKKISASGLGKHNMELSSSTSAHIPTEDIQIVPWHGGVPGSLVGDLASMPMSANLYRHLSFWSKPETAGHVSLYAVDPATSRMWFLATAKPFTKNPSWRRYRLLNQSCCGANILIYGKLACRKLRGMDEILPIQNIPAIKAMAQAIEFENKQQLKSAMEYEAQAIRLMSEQKADHDSTGFEVQVIDHDVDLMGASVRRCWSR
jgi:hypothetical protein